MSRYTQLFTALTATSLALSLSSCSVLPDAMTKPAESVASAVSNTMASDKDNSSTVLDPTTAHIATIVGVTDLTIDDAKNPESMARDALARIYGLEVTADGRLLAVAAPPTARSDSSQQPTATALADPKNNSALTTAHILDIDPSTGIAEIKQNVALGEDFQTMAGSFSQIRNGWGITQLIGQDPNNDKNAVRSADTWTVTGATGLTGYNTNNEHTNNADPEAATSYTMPAADPAVGICAMESSTLAPIDEHRPLSNSALRTASVLASSGSPALTLRDPMIMTTIGAIQTRAYVDGEVIMQHDLDALREQMGVEDSDGTKDTNNTAPLDPLAALGLNAPTTSALVPGLAELDCLNAEQARVLHSREDNPIGTGKPGVLAVINAEMADDYTLQIISDPNSQQSIAKLPERTAFVLIDPDGGAVTDLFYIQTFNPDLPAPLTQINSVALDQRDPNIVWATFADDDRLYQMVIG